MKDASSAVMTSINGRSATENLKAALEDLVNEIKEQLEAFRINKMTSIDPDTSALLLGKDKSSLHLSQLLQELRETAVSFSSLDEMIAMFPPWTRIFHTRSRQATDTDYTLYRFIQIGAYAIDLDSATPSLKFTPEDSQDYVTMRYKVDGATREDMALVRRIESLDRMTVLKLWMDGYPVHQALVPYLEDMYVVHIRGVLDIPVFQIPISFMWNSQHQLRQRKWISGRNVEIPDFERGMCLPDHSCCNQAGMFDENLRRIVFGSPVEQRELIQVENLTQRMQAEYNAQKLNR